MYAGTMLSISVLFIFTAILWDKYYDYPHFADEETGSGRLNNWPKDTQYVEEVGFEFRTV